MGSFTRARADQRGFTLAELLVAIAIVGLIMTGLLTLLMAGNESYLAGANQVEAQAAVRAGLERMTPEIREAGYAPCTPPPSPPPGPCQNAVAIPDAITNPTPTSFTIQNDWDASGAIAPGTVPVQYFYGGVATNVNRGEQITYSIVGGNLTRQESAVDAQPQTLVTSVTQATIGGALQPYFQYLDVDGNVTAVPANIRTVVVNLRAGVQGQTPGSWQTGAIQVTMSDRIRLRNRIP